MSISKECLSNKVELLLKKLDDLNFSLDFPDSFENMGDGEFLNFKRVQFNNNSAYSVSYFSKTDGVFLQFYVHKAGGSDIFIRCDECIKGYDVFSEVSDDFGVIEYNQKKILPGGFDCVKSELENILD